MELMGSCQTKMKKAEERWGAGVVEQVSMDLKREFPDADGFSTSNLWYMKKWYLFYTKGDAEEKLQRVVGEHHYGVCLVGIARNSDVDTGFRGHLPILILRDVEAQCSLCIVKRLLLFLCHDI